MHETQCTNRLIGTPATAQRIETTVKNTSTPTDARNPDEHALNGRDAGTGDAAARRLGETSPDAYKAGAPREEFEQLAEERQPGFFQEFWQFLKYNKKWWLLPILLWLALIGVLAIASSSVLAPFIYTLF